MDIQDNTEIKTPWKKIIIVGVIIIALIIITEVLGNFVNFNLFNLPFNSLYLKIGIGVLIIIIIYILFLIKKYKSEESPKERTPEQKQVISEEIKKQREPIKEAITKPVRKKTNKSEWVPTGVEGLDKLTEKGIPRGTSVLVAGGAGSGKTILTLQILTSAAMRGEKVLYVSLEESEFRLKKHLNDFGWKPNELEKKGLLKIIRIDPFSIARSVEALLSKAKGELKMDIVGVEDLIPKGYEPDWIVIDSLTALSAAFKEDDASYRIYIEQLFRYLEKLGITSFLISETEQIPVRFSKSGVEEFLADGVVVLYNIKRGNIRENAIEILKLRGVTHQKRVVAMQITSRGIIVYPEQEVFGGIEEE